MLLVLSILPLTSSSLKYQHDEVFVCEQVTSTTLQIAADVILLLLALLAIVCSLLTIVLYRRVREYVSVKQVTSETPTGTPETPTKTLETPTKTPEKALPGNSSKNSVPGEEHRKACSISAVVMMNLLLKLPLYIVEGIRRYNMEPLSFTGTIVVIILFVICSAILNPVFHLIIQKLDNRDTKDSVG